MASGLPVVASDIPGYASVIEHGKQGLLVEPRNEETLAMALIRVLADADLRQKLGINGLIENVRAVKDTDELALTQKTIDLAEDGILGTKFMLSAAGSLTAVGDLAANGGDAYDYAVSRARAQGLVVPVARERARGVRAPLRVHAPRATAVDEVCQGVAGKRDRRAIDQAAGGR